MELQKVKSITSLPLNGLSIQYKSDVKLFNDFTNGQIVTPNLIIDYFDKMKVNNKAIATIQRHKASIKKAMLLVMGQGVNLIEQAQLDVFFKDIKTGKRELAKTREDVLNENELSLLIQKSGHKTSLIIRALYETASRISELVNIKYSDCQVRSDGVIIKVIGKGSKEGKFFMSVDLFNAIKETYKGKIYLFENSKGDHIGTMTAYTMIKRVGKKIGRPDIHPHTLRHTWATISMPILGLAKVSGYLRHSSIDTTAKYYLHGKAEMPEILAVNTLKMKG